MNSAGDEYGTMTAEAVIRVVAGVLLLSGSLALASEARAEAGSMDLELVDPSFARDSLPGIESARIEGAGALHVGSFLQYEREPLLVHVRRHVHNAVVQDRLSSQSGFSYDWSPWLSTSLLLPAAAQQGSSVPELSAPGVGFRDPRLSARLRIVRAGPISTALRVGYSAPLGTPNAWMGEEAPRYHGGLLLHARAPWLDVLADLGLTHRPLMETGLDFELGTELSANLGLRARVWPDRAALYGAILTRGGVATLWTRGAENPAEWLGGLQCWPSSGLQLDLGLGNGLVRGYGTTSLRLFAGLTLGRAPRRERGAGELRPVIARVEESPPEIREAVQAQRPWNEGELARVEDRQIVIREPIRFEFGTARILPESKPVLDAIVSVMADYWQLAHVVIVGHASEEGSFTYNDDLSVSRARSVYRALVESGIHPLRLSYKGMGEVEPSGVTTTEPELAKNRRVEFHIIQLLSAVDPQPTYPLEIRLPWTGERIATHESGQKLLGVSKEPELQEPQPLDLLKGYLREEKQGEEVPDEGKRP